MNVSVDTDIEPLVPAGLQSGTDRDDELSWGIERLGERELMTGAHGPGPIVERQAWTARQRAPRNPHARHDLLLAFARARQQAHTRQHVAHERARTPRKRVGEVSGPRHHRTRAALDTQKFGHAQIKIGGFVLEVGVWMLYVRVPAIGEVCWTPQLGVTANR